MQVKDGKVIERDANADPDAQVKCDRREVRVTENEPKVARELFGTVVEASGSSRQFYAVECPDAPEYLKLMFLRGFQMGGAKVGDRVRLEYQVSARAGLWNVVEVIR